MRRVVYGVIGLGFFGEKHVEVAAALPQVELRAICTRRDERRRAIQARFGVPHEYRDYRELLADPQIEAVSIVTHVDDHVAPTIAALRAGKQVLLEKPMARTTADCDRILDAVEQTGQILMVGHICRFNPRYAVVQERIAAGELGRIVSMYARRNIPAERSATVLANIGPLLGDGIHDTDLMLWMSNQPVRTVYAQTLRVRTDEPQIKHPDIGWAMYRFADGAIGVIENVWFLPQGTPFRIHEQLEIIGTAGAAYVHGGDTNVVIQTGSRFDCPDTVYWPQVHGETLGALRNEISYFVDCVRAGRRPSVVTPRAARNAVQVLEGAEQSAATGTVVTLPDFPTGSGESA